MKPTDVLRNSIIDKLLAITNKNYLSALNRLIDTSAVDKDTIHLTPAQISMLKLSDKDIEAGDLIPHDQLNKDDLRWLKGL